MRFAKARRSACATLVLICVGCAPRPGAPGITVAAAANLTDAFQAIAGRFETSAGVHVVLSFAATGDLTRQIENAAPFDVFAAADTSHIDQLDREGLLTPGTKSIYARGRLALWTPPGGSVHIRSLQDLAGPQVRFVAIAKPEIAPYGAAAVESLRKLDLWDRVGPKVVYAENISMAKQYASTYNADASFTAYSLVIHAGGNTLLVDESLHAPIDQGMAVIRASPKQAMALKFLHFVLGAEGRKILERYGYAAVRV